MTDQHLSTERLFEASEGIDFLADEISHLRDCSDCREVLSLLTRYKRQRLQKLANGSIAHHVPLAELWNYGQGSEIDGTYHTHLLGCELCAGVLGVCRKTSSLREVLKKLKDSGLNIE